MNTYTSDYLIGMGDGYRKCYEKMQHTLYEIQSDMIDLNNRGGVGNVLSEAEGKDNKGFALQDVVLYNDLVWKTQRAGMVVSSGELVVILSEKGSVVTERLEDVTFIGHIYSLKHPTTLIDAIEQVKKKYMEANKR